LNKLDLVKKKYPKEVGEINTGEVFTKETEYSKGGTC
jgi:hypothetical protein